MARLERATRGDEMVPRWCWRFRGCAEELSWSFFLWDFLPGVVGERGSILAAGFKSGVVLERRCRGRPYTQKQCELSATLGVIHIGGLQVENSR